MVLFTREQKIASKIVYKGHICNMRVDEVKKGDHTLTREVIEHSGGVVIVCQPEPDLVVLVKQYRYCVDKDLLELPAGRLEIGEDPLAAAQRELVEETGYSAKDWDSLAKMFSAPGFCDEMLHVYRARDVSLGEKRLDHDEETEVIILSIHDAWQQAQSGQICDAKTIAGIALLHKQF